MNTNTLVGQKFGHLTVMSLVRQVKSSFTWLCRCDCGEDKEACTTFLKSGRTVSCGCVKSEFKFSKPSKKLVDMTGRRFNRLVVIERAENNIRGQATWRCLCDCGATRVVEGGSLRTGNTKSCGCLSADTSRARRTKHGRSKSAEHIIWCAINSRCSNQNARSYKDYGGRGITVCDRWLNSFENFFADMGPRPSAEHSIERNENSKGYSPDNCRWATRVEQGSNKRNNHLLTYKGETKTVAEWARTIGMEVRTLRHRITRYGWSVEQAISTPALSRSEAAKVSRLK